MACLPIDAREAYQANRYVFTAQVQSVLEAGELPSRREEGVKNTYSMAVVKLEEVYKGRVFGPIKVYANNYWGEPFEPGESYLFYANMEGALMVVPDCSGPTPVAEAADQLEILGELHP